MMPEAGILDPAKVVIAALEHASSIGSLVLTTEALVHPDDSDDDDDVMDQYADMMDGYDDAAGMGGMDYF